MAQQTLTSVSSFSGTEETPVSITYATLKLRANESSGTNAFKLTVAPAPSAGVMQYSADGGTSWIDISTADYAAGVWYSTAGVTVAGITYPGSLRFMPALNARGALRAFSLRASSAVGVDADLSSTDVSVNVNVAGTQDPGAVVITGNGAIGQLLTATASDPDGVNSQVSYQWQVNTGTSIAPVWGDVSGATASSFTPTASEAGREVRACASYTDALGKAEVVYSDALAIFMAVQAVRVWTGSVWVDAKALRRHDGAQWVDIPISAIRALP